MTAFVVMACTVATLLNEQHKVGRVVITESDIDNEYPANYTFSGFNFDQPVELRATDGTVYGTVWDYDRKLLMVKLTEHTCKYCGMTVYKQTDGDETFYVDHTDGDGCSENPGEDIHKI